MEISQKKPIEATSEDALEVANMLTQMKKSIIAAKDSREWKIADDSNLSSVISDIEKAVFHLVHYYFSDHETE